MRDVPITVVALLEENIRVVVVPGHHRKQEAIDLARQIEPLPAEGSYQVWTATFDSSNPKKAAEIIMDNAKKLYAMIFK